MTQLEITYFWPLTEQLSLGLDCSRCDTRVKITQGVSILGGTGISPSWVTTSQTLSVANVSSKGVTIDCGTLTIKGTPMPWYRKLMFKVMGFKYD
jgi:hypothetical protein